MKDLAATLAGIEVEGMSLAQKAAIVREMMEYLKITNEQVEEYGKQGITEETQKGASSSLSPVVGEVVQLASDEAKVISTELEPISFVAQNAQNNGQNKSNDKVNQANGIRFEPESLINSKSKNDDNSNTGVEESKEDKEQIADDSQIQQFVIPVIVDRINLFGKQEKESPNIVYQGEEYTASLKLEKNTQTLSLDRNSPELEENKEALLASKYNNSQEYSIVVNHLTQEEFERFKALFQEQQIRREQSLKQHRNKESGSELD
jgi:hypothetical protein